MTNEQRNKDFYSQAWANARYFSRQKGKVASQMARQWYCVASMYGGANA